jgi:ribosome recycling factor
MPADEILMECEEHMEKTVKKIHDDFAAVRTGKASPQLVDSLRVDCYGTTMTLRELAGITCPEPRLIMIQPWDVANVDPIRKAIETSNLGISPLVDGKIIRIPIPELSEERRRDLIKVVKKIAEDGRIAIRHSRRDALDMLKKEQKDGDLSEDELKVAEKDVQKLTDEYTGKIDKMLETKQAELLKV